MKTIKSAILLQQLMESSISLLEDISRLEEYTGTGQLEMNDGEGRWNIVQVLEHLNSYYAYYLPIIEKNLQVPTQHHELFLRRVGLAPILQR